MKKGIIIFFVFVGIGVLLWLKFWFVSPHKSDYSGPVTANDPLPKPLISEMEDYVKKVMKENNIPGLAMVFVKGDEVVYSKGLGVRDFSTKNPVTTETLFGIGSATKPITAIAIASMVDSGVFDWTTKITEILPSFALSNKDLTEKLTIEDTLCMCTGVPRRMEEISVRYAEMSAEDIIESLKKIPLVNTYGTTYNYSSRMISVGGYITSIAAGGAYGNLAEDYQTMMEELIFDPLEMTVSTFSIDEAVASSNYAVPHYSSLSGLQALSPEIEGIFTPIAPAGALWSNVEDMSKFVIMLLKKGVSYGGEEIVSSKNLAYLWKPRIKADEKISYGLGWNIENYHGLNVYFHPGGTVGFASELVIIPDLDIGFVLLTNQLDQVTPIGRLATYRLLEMLTGSKQVYDRQVGKTARNIDFQLLQLKLLTKRKVNPKKIEPFLGHYHNDMLGEIELVIHDDNTLWVDFGEYESSVRPFIFRDDQLIFFESVFVGKTLTLRIQPNGGKTIQWSGDEAPYIFTD